MANKMKSLSKYLKKNKRMVFTGLGLGLAGAWYYLKVIPRETVAKIGGRAAGLDHIVMLTPEVKVFVGFITLGFLLAMTVNYVIDGRK